MRNLIWFLIVLVFVLQAHEISSVSSSKRHLCHSDESLALLQFKQMFQTSHDASTECDNGQYPHPKMRSWNDTSDCCTWKGITCHRITGHVIGIDLSCSQLQGAIHADGSLFNLSHLQKLNLAYNDFKNSPISHVIGGLTSLTNLNLAKANFHGPIPSEISHLSKLVVLDLSQNAIEFKHKDFQLLLRNLTQVRELALSNVGIFSELPVNFSSSLTLVDLRQTQVYGKLPDHIFHLEKLQQLLLGGTRVTGSLPNFNCSASSMLRNLDLTDTSFFGELPNSFGCLKSLNALLLDGCQFTGHLPDSIGNLSQLNKMSLAQNSFNGPLPSQISNLVQLEHLDLTSNQLQGQIPDSFTNLQKLTELLLTNNSLNGSFPPTIANLTNLETLDLGSNSITGPLPDSIGNLSQLNRMCLDQNSFNGPLPSQISNLVQLEHLDLTSNQLQGQIPDSFTNLQKLTELLLTNNSLNGSFPPTIANLTNLETLDLRSNSITGPLPSNASGLQGLFFLYLSNNLLHGTIPTWLFCLQSLTILLLKNNQLTGELPQMEEPEGMELFKIDLSNNQLQGRIPKSISTQPFLNFLDLSSNNLSGVLEISSDSLDYLVLSNNRLSWNANENVSNSLPNLHRLELSSCEIKAFPEFLKGSKKLEVLRLSDNKILGQIPSWLTSMPWDSLLYLNLSYNLLSRLDPLPWNNLRILDVRSNKIQGQLPLFICNLKDLAILDLSRNKFTGGIPQCFGNFSSQLVVLNLERNGLQRTINSMVFAKDSRLRYLGLNGNLLEGPLPVTLANCKYLEVLDLGNNQVKDTFPAWLENLTELRVLVLSFNKFFGPIRIFKARSAFQKLLIFDLSSNEFSGVLAPELLESFTAMKSLQGNKSESKYLHTNGNTTYYLYSVGLVVKGKENEYTKIFRTLATIDLSGNKFHGKIPDVIGNLYSLKLLNLSNNNFSGHIPSSIGNLRSLETLDLSRNQIGGEIPRQLTNLTFLAALNLSYNHLVGRIPQANQFTTFGSNSYSGNSGLCGFPLANSCDDVPQAPPKVVSEEGKDTDFMGGFTWKSVLIGYGCGLVLGMAIGFLMFVTRKPEGLVRIVEDEIYSYSLLLSGKKKNA